MGFERRVSSDVLENFVFNLLSKVYPHAYLRHEPRRLGTSIGVTKPDFVFALPEQETEVFLEVTKSQLRPGLNCKSGQRGILHEYVNKHKEYAALVLYLQNFAEIPTLESSLTILEGLASGQFNTSLAQQQINGVALNSGIPYDLHGNQVDWYSLYDQATQVIRPRN